MKFGNLNIILFIFLFFSNFACLNAQEKINLQDLQPTFEEESDANEFNKSDESSKIRSIYSSPKRVTLFSIDLHAWTTVE